jgi:hypothetical protein
MVGLRLYSPTLLSRAQQIDRRLRSGGDPLVKYSLRSERKGSTNGRAHYEEFKVGQKFIHPIRRTVIEMDNMLFAALTYNPAAVQDSVRFAWFVAANFQL